MNTPASSALSAAPRKGRGCLFYGCLTTVVAVLIALVAIYFVATRAIRKAVETYGTTAPLSIPVAEISPDQYREVEQRILTFRDSILKGENPEPLVLSSRDINALIQYDKAFRGITGYVTFENSKLAVRGSVPLEPFGYKGMYLSGTARLRVGVTADAPEVKLDELSIGEQRLPAELMDQLRSQNFAANAAEQYGGKAFWKRIDRIEVLEDSMLLHPVARR